MDFAVFKAILLWATIREFTIFWETIWIERLYIPIYFGRFDSEISDMKKIHANGQSLKFAGQNLDFCGKITQKSKILWKSNSFFPTNRIFPLICFENFYVKGLYVIQKRYIRRLHFFQLYFQMYIKSWLWTQLLHKYTLKICGFLKFAVFLQSGSRITTYV